MLLVFALAAALPGVDAGSFGPVIPAVREGLGLDDPQAAWLLSANVLGGVYGAPWAAWLAARHGAARTLAGALLVATIGALGMAAASSFAQACAARGLLGVGTAAVLPLATAAVSARVPEAGRGGAIVRLSLAYGVAFLVATASASAVGALAWRAVYVGVAALALGAGLAVLRARGGHVAAHVPLPWRGALAWTVFLAALGVIVPQLRAGPVVARAGAASIGVAWPLVAAGVTALVALVAITRAPGGFVPLGLAATPGRRGPAALAVGTGAAQVFAVSLPSFAAVVVGVAPARVGLWSLPFVLAGLVGTAAAAVLIDRLGAARLVAGSAVALVLGAVALAGVPPSTLPFALVSALLGAGLCTLSGGPIRRLVSEGSEADDARAQAMLALATNLGLLVGSAVYAALTSGGDGVAERAAGMRDATLGLAALITAALVVGGVLLRVDTPPTPASTSEALG